MLRPHWGTPQESALWSSVQVYLPTYPHCMLLDFLLPLFSWAGVSRDTPGVPSKKKGLSSAKAVCVTTCNWNYQWAPWTGAAPASGLPGLAGLNLDTLVSQPLTSLLGRSPYTASTLRPT
jgi:hypothetical protein